MNTTINLEEFGGTILGILTVGAFLKNAFPAFPNRFIPLLTWAMGALAYLTLSNGWTDPKQYLAAIITAATATGLHSGVKNTVGDAKPASGIGALLMCGLLLVPAATLTGCAGSPKPFQAVSVTVITVDSAMTAWGKYVAQYKPSEADEMKVKAAHEKYQASMIVVADAGKAYSEGTGPQGSLDIAIANSAVALGDLIALLQKLGVQL